MKKTAFSFVVLLATLAASHSIASAVCSINSEKLFGAFKTAIEIGDEAAIEQLVGEGCDVNVQGGHAQWTPLHLVAMKGSEEMAAALIKAGAKTNIKDAKGRTYTDYVERKARRNADKQDNQPNQGKVNVNELFGAGFDSLKDAYREYTGDTYEDPFTDENDDEEPTTTTEVKNNVAETANEEPTLSWYEFFFGPSLTEHPTEADKTTFTNAIVSGDLSTVRKLLKSGTQTCQRELLGSDAHHTLSLILEANKGKNRLEILEELLKTGLDFDAKTRSGFTYCDLHRTKCDTKVKALFEKYRNLRKK